MRNDDKQEEHGPIFKPMVNAACKYLAIVGGVVLASQGDYLEAVLLGGIYALAATDGPWYDHKVESEPEYTDVRDIEDYDGLADEDSDFDDEVPRARLMWAS